MLVRQTADLHWFPIIELEGFKVTKHLDQAIAIKDDPTSDGPDASDSLLWAFINSWKVEPQFNDRPPVERAVVPNSESASGVRSMTRRKQQARFKEWSQARHE